MIEYLIANKEWIFSGVGVAVLSWLLFRKSASSNMNQKGGDNSTNIQVGRDFKSGSKDKKSGDK